MRLVTYSFAQARSRPSTTCMRFMTRLTLSYKIDFRFDEPETQGTTGQSARQTAVTAARSKKARRNRGKARNDRPLAAVTRPVPLSPRCRNYRPEQNKCLRFGRQTELLENKVCQSRRNFLTARFFAAARSQNCARSPEIRKRRNRARLGLRWAPRATSSDSA